MRRLFLLSIFICLIGAHQLSCDGCSRGFDSADDACEQAMTLAFERGVECAEIEGVRVDDTPAELAAAFCENRCDLSGCFNGDLVNECIDSLGYKSCDNVVDATALAEGKIVLKSAALGGGRGDCSWLVSDCDF